MTLVKPQAPSNALITDAPQETAELQPSPQPSTEDSLDDSPPPSASPTPTDDQPEELGTPFGNFDDSLFSPTERTKCYLTRSQKRQSNCAHTTGDHRPDDQPLGISTAEFQQLQADDPTVAPLSRTLARSWMALPVPLLAVDSSSVMASSTTTISHPGTILLMARRNSWSSRLSAISQSYNSPTVSPSQVTLADARQLVLSCSDSIGQDYSETSANIATPVRNARNPHPKERQKLHSSLSLSLMCHSSA